MVYHKLKIFLDFPPTYLYIIYSVYKAKFFI